MVYLPLYHRTFIVIGLWIRKRAPDARPSLFRVILKKRLRYTNESGFEAGSHKSRYLRLFFRFLDVREKFCRSSLRIGVCIHSSIFTSSRPLLPRTFLVCMRRFSLRLIAKNVPTVPFWRGFHSKFLFWRFFAHLFCQSEDFEWKHHPKKVKYNLKPNLPTLLYEKSRVSHLKNAVVLLPKISRI